jgi:hypothetical protein
MRIAPGSPGGTAHPQAATPRPTAAPRSFTSLLDERAGGTSRTPSTPASSPAAGPTTTPPPAHRSAGPIRTMLERAVGSEKQIDAILDAAARGKTFKPGELLALQATVARYSQTVEVVSRVADRLVGAIKQTMGTQV